MSDIIKDIKDYFDKSSGFIKSNNYKLIDLDLDYAVMEGVIDENSMNPYGIVHGGYLYGLLDTTAGYAACTSGYKAYTLNANINYLSQCKGNVVRAEAKAVKSGKHIKVYEVNLYDGDNLICNGIASYYVLDTELEK